MKTLKSYVFPVLLATLWISLSEFFRNEFLLKSYWTEHFERLGILFPDQAVNGAIWGLWSLLFAIFIFILSKKFGFWQTILLAWFAGFVFMWVVTGNLGVLPYRLLYFAVPLSLIEAGVATWIIRQFRSR